MDVFIDIGNDGQLLFKYLPFTNELYTVNKHFYRNLKIYMILTWKMERLLNIGDGKLLLQFVCLCNKEIYLINRHFCGICAEY